MIIAGAGGAAHLPGMVAALTPLPVIGVPVKPAGAHLDGLDALLSIVQVLCHLLRLILVPLQCRTDLMLSHKPYLRLRALPGCSIICLLASSCQSQSFRHAQWTACACLPEQPMAEWLCAWQTLILQGLQACTGNN